MAAWETLKAEGIEIPFPQLDLHVQSARQEESAGRAL